MVSKRLGSAVLLTALVLVPGCSGESPAGLLVEDARVRELIPGQDKTAGYFDLTNTGNEPVVIVQAESAAVRAIEFHTTRRDGEVMRMRRLSEVRIDPGQKIRFQTGGHHLMLFGVRSLEDPTEIHLITSDGISIPVRFRRIAIGD